MKQCQVYIAVSIPGQSRIISYGQDSDAYMALMAALRGTFKHLEIRAGRPAEESVQKGRGKKDVVKDIINILDQYGWHGKSGGPAWAWMDFRKIPKEEYLDYVEIVEEFMPRESALYEKLKTDFNSGLIRPVQGVRYRYLCELIASIAYVSASGQG